MGSPELPAVGTRLNHSGFLGTIRFVGPVDGTKGTWLGVEWDEPHRGKHSGEKDGRRYFDCLVPGAGSFLRPTAAVSYGRTFFTALVEKYDENPHGSALEKVVLGSSRGAIEVEAVGLDRIRGNLSQIERLREVSLDNEGVASADPPGIISCRCAGVRGLDLSKNLIPSWTVVAQIASELSHLQRLALNQNRLQLPRSGLLPPDGAFAHLRELQLNTTLTTWSELRALLNCMPALRLVEMGYNRLAALDCGQEEPAQHALLEELNLDSNELRSWPDVCAALQPFQALQRVILAANNIETIPPREAAHKPLEHLTHLFLSFNRLKTWRDIDALPLWCPRLESLGLAGNPLVLDPELGKNARQLTIAKIPTLLMLDAAAISPKERTDSELFYLSHVAKRGPDDEDARRREHPQWSALCAKYGRPDITAATRQARQDTLSNRLIELHVHQSAELPKTTGPGGSPADAETTSLRVLPTMSVRSFRMKVLKSLKIPRMTFVQLWLRMPDGSLVEIDDAQDGRDLDWWGVEDGSDVILYISHG